MAADLFPYLRFQFELDGMTQGAFERVDPPGERVGIAMDDARRLQPEGPVVRLPARLFGGVANTRELFAWFSRSSEDRPEPRSVVLVERDEEGREIARHRYDGAFPVKLRLAPLTPEQQNRVAEMELAVERWTREASAPTDGT